jgi:cell division protein FtsN
MALAPQRIMENQNAYATSAEAGFDDVLEIPTPLRSAQPASEHMLVLEDVIPVHDLSVSDEITQSELEFADAREDSMSESERGHLHTAESAALNVEKNQLAGPQSYGASQTSPFDYEGGHAWLRIAPLLLLLGALVFFALYYLGNRVGVSDKPPDVAATQEAQPETQSTAPASVPENSQNGSQSSQPAESVAVNTPAQDTAVAAKDETPKPVEKPATETAKRESKLPATVAAPVAAPVATAPAAPAPVANQGTGNFTVQVGSYNNAAQADERVSRLRASGVEARVVRAEIPHRGTWYRVQAGRFASNAEAARYASELKGKGATADFVITSFQGQ